jgi:hypothetical protein
MKKDTAKRQVSNENASNVVKVRLMGTENDIKSYSKELENSISNWKIKSQSELLNLINSSRYKRKYIEVEKNNDNMEER